jgi:hypothetical protein
MQLGAEAPVLSIPLVSSVLCACLLPCITNMHHFPTGPYHMALDSSHHLYSACC